MINIHDHTGKFISIISSPKRIISLVPSQTELLYDLGLDESVVGITKFCVHPRKWFETKKRVGGTKNINIDIIKSLQPDLIIANKEENVREQIELLEEYCPVFTTNVSDLSSALKMIKDIGTITQTNEIADVISVTILEKFNALSLNRSLRALYLIWKNPYMAAGGNTFINDMMHHAGLLNVLSDLERYPQLSERDIIDLKPDIILLSSEPYPFKTKHIVELEQIYPNAHIILLDGEMFSWYGSRMLYSGDYFITLNQQLNELYESKNSL